MRNVASPNISFDFWSWIIRNVCPFPVFLTVNSITLLFEFARGVNELVVASTSDYMGFLQSFDVCVSLYLRKLCLVCRSKPNIISIENRNQWSRTEYQSRSPPADNFCPKFHTSIGIVPST